MAFDISQALRPVVVRTSFLGTVHVEVRKQSFYDWFRTGRDEGKWANPEALVRALLSEQSSLRSTAKSPAADRVDALSKRQLNAFAKALIKVAGVVIAPRHIEDSRGKLRARGEGESYPLDREQRENDSARLWRLLSARDDEQRAIERQRATELRKLLEGPKDWLRQIDPLADQMDKLRREVIGTSLGAQMIATGAASAELTRSSALSFIKADEISRAIGHMAGVRSFYASAIRERELLGSQLADRTSAISLAREAVRSMTLGSSMADTFLRAAITPQAAWGESIAKFIISGLAGGLAGSIMGAHARMSVSEAIETAAGLSRGFRTAANVGLAGVAPRGAAAEALRHYHADSPTHSDVFREVMRGIERLDLSELHDEELSAALANAHATKHRIDLTDPVQTGVFLALMSLLVAVYMAILAQKTLEVARASATSANVAAITAEMKGLRHDLNKGREDQRSEWRDIRFVADVTALRAQPDRRAMVLLQVYPDQLLRILEVKSAWARVQVLPYKSREPTSGWISRSRLRARPT